MKTFAISLFMTGAVLLAVQAAPETAAVSTPDAEASVQDVSSAVTNAQPALEYKITKLYSQGNEFARLASIDVGDEFVGLTVPTGYQMKGTDDGRKLTVFLDSAHHNWVNFEFHTNEFVNFSQETVWPAFEELLENQKPVFFTTYVMDRPVLGFVSKSGSVTTGKQEQVQLIPLKGGTLSVKTVAFGNEGKRVFLKVKQLVTSLQFAEDEKNLKKAEPKFED